MKMSDSTKRRELSLAELLSELPVGHRARKEFNDLCHNLSIANNKVEELENAILKKTKKEQAADKNKFSSNALKATEIFVKQGGISRDETHVDFNINSGNAVTWCLSDEPELRTTPSLYVRRISDVRKIIRLTEKNQILLKQRDEFEASLAAELGCRNALQMEVEMLNKKIAEQRDLLHRYNDLINGDVIQMKGSSLHLDTQKSITSK